MKSLWCGFDVFSGAMSGSAIIFRTRGIVVFPRGRSVGYDLIQSMSIRASPGNGEEKVEKEKIAVIGSGNWGSVAAKLVARNALLNSRFHGMWVTTAGCEYACVRVRQPRLKATLQALIIC